MVPQDYRFLKSHEWAKVDGDVVTVGISDYAVQALGDIVFIELPSPGKQVAREAAFGVIESVKAAVELYAPVSGEIIESNKPLAENFELLAKDPYGAAWMVKIKASNIAEAQTLLDADAYEKYLQSPEAQH